MTPENSQPQKNHYLCQPMNKKGIANLLGVSVFILNKWVALIEDELGLPLGRLYNAKQVALIVERYGVQSQKEEGDQIS